MICLFMFIVNSEHECEELCSVLYADICRYVQNTDVLPVAVGGETLY